VDELIEWDAVVGAVGGVASSGWVGVAVGGADGTIGDGGGRSTSGIRSGLDNGEFAGVGGSEGSVERSASNKETHVMIGVSQTLKRIADACKPKLPLPFHAHTLRHSCGYWLANQGCDKRLIQYWLGHQSIKHTVWNIRIFPEMLIAPYGGCKYSETMYIK
jgi:hypothetical protein